MVVVVDGVEVAGAVAAARHSVMVVLPNLGTRAVPAALLDLQL